MKRVVSMAATLAACRCTMNLPNRDQIKDPAYYEPSKVSKSVTPHLVAVSFTSSDFVLSAGSQFDCIPFLASLYLPLSFLAFRRESTMLHRLQTTCTFSAFAPSCLYFFNILLFYSHRATRGSKKCCNYQQGAPSVQSTLLTRVTLGFRVRTTEGCILEREVIGRE